MKKSLASLLTLPLLYAAGQGQSTKSDPFLEAVRKRESAVKVVDITFRMTEFRPKNSPVPMAELPLPDSAPAKTLAQDAVLESTNRIVIQGDSTRFEGNHPVWHVASGKHLSHQRLHVTNSKAVKSFYPQGRGKDTQMAGAVTQSQRNSFMMDYYLLPIGVAFRGTNRNLTPNPVQLFKTSSARQLIEGRECLEYAHTVGKEARLSYLVDPQRDYNVVRFALMKQGRLVMQIDIKYARNEVCGWVPEAWDEHLYTSTTGKLERRTEVRVLSCTINESLSESQFDIEFPRGTRLWVPADNQYYYVEEDGRLRPISPGDKQMSSEFSPQEAWYRRYQLWVLGFVMIIAVVVLWVKYRRGSK